MKKVFLSLNAAFITAILYLNSRLQITLFVIMPTRLVQHSTQSCCTWSIIIWAKDGCLDILITLVSSTFISMPQQLPISISLPNTPCGTSSSLVPSTRPSAYFRVVITCPSILMSPKPSRASLVRYSLHQPNTIDDEQYPVTHLPTFRLLVFPWSSFTLTLWFKYNFLFKVLSTEDDDVPGDVLEILEDVYLRTVKQQFNNMYKTREWPNISLNLRRFS